MRRTAAVVRVIGCAVALRGLSTSPLLRAPRRRATSNTKGHGTLNKKTKAAQTAGPHHAIPPGAVDEHVGGAAGPRVASASSPAVTPVTAGGGAEVSVHAAAPDAERPLDTPKWAPREFLSHLIARGHECLAGSIGGGGGSVPRPHIEAQDGLDPHVTVRRASAPAPSSAPLTLQASCEHFALLFTASLRLCTTRHEAEVLLFPSTSLRTYPALASTARMMAGTPWLHTSVASRQWHIGALGSALQALALRFCEGGSTHYSEFTRELLAAITARTLPTGSQLRMELGLCLGGLSALSTSGGGAAARVDTLINTLQRTVLEVQLVACLLDAADSSSEVPAALTLRRTAYALLNAIATQNYVLHEQQRGGGGIPSASSAHYVEQHLRGLRGLLQYSMRSRHTHISGTDHPRVQRVKGDVCQVTLLLITLYTGLLPHAVAASVEAAAAGEGPSSTVVVEILAGIHESWTAQEPAIVSGSNVSAALWWLQIAASLLEANLAAVERRLVLSAAAGAAVGAEAALLDETMGQLAITHSSLVPYSRADYERCRATLAGGAAPTDRGNDQGAGVVRRRGKRSLFAASDAATSVLRSTSASEDAGHGAAKAPARFESRRHADGSGGGGGEVTGRGGGGAATGLESGGGGGGGLFRVFVMLRDTPGVLQREFGLTRHWRSGAVEEAWLRLVLVSGELRRALYGFPSPLDGRSGAKSADADTSLARSPDAEARAAVSALQVSTLPFALRPLFDSVASAPDAASTTRQKQAEALRVLDSTRAHFPLQLFEAIGHLTNSITGVLLALYDDEGNLTNERTPSSESELAALGSQWMVRQHRSGVMAALVIGAQELLTDSTCGLDNVASTAHIRAATLMPGRSPLGGDGGSAAEEVVHGAFSVELVRELTHKGTGPATDMVWHKSTRALAVLRASTAGKSAGVSLDGFPLLRLSLYAKQVAASVVARNLSVISAACRSGMKVESEAQRRSILKRGAKCLTDLLHLLEADPQLLLACSYPAFIDVLVEARVRLHLNAEVVVSFGDHYLLPLMLPVIVTCLRASAAEDTPATHDALCGQTLFLLATLSRLASNPVKDVSDIMRTAWTDTLAQVSAYCLRHTPLENLKRVGSYGQYVVALPEVQWREELHGRACAGLMQRDGSSCYGMNLLYFLDSSNSLVGRARVQPAFAAHSNQVVQALREYHGALRASPPRFPAEPPGDTATGADLEDLARRAAAGHAAAQAWYGALTPAQLAGARELPFIGEGVRRAAVLGCLLRFMEHYVREQSRRAQRLLVYKEANDQLATNARVASRARRVTQTGSVETGGVAKALGALEGSPFILLDFIGHLNSAGGWTMVCYTLSCAETALSVQHQRHRAAVEQVRESAATAILSQLRCVPPPLTTTSEPLSTAQQQRQQQQGLPLSLLKCISGFADALTSTPTTLLGFKGRSKLRGVLAHPDRAECRVVLYAVKQIALYVEEGSRLYTCPTSASSSSSSQLLLGAMSGEDLAEDAGTTAITGDESAQCLPPYYASLPSASSSPSAADGVVTLTRSASTRDSSAAMGYFLCCLISAVDLVLETVRHHVLQQRIVSEEMCGVLAAAFGSVCQTLCNCINTYVDLPRERREGAFAEEHGTLLWVGLSTVAMLGTVAPLDHERTFFRGRVQAHIEDVLSAVDHLVTLVDSGGADQRGAQAPAAMCGTLVGGVRSLIQHMLLSRRVALSFGILHRDYNDLSSTLSELYALARPAATHQPAAAMFNRVWRSVMAELAAVAERAEEESERLRTPDSLHVKSLAALRHALDGFNELDRMEAARITPTRGGEERLQWSCDVDSLLVGVLEDPSIGAAPGSRKRQGTEEEEDDLEMAAMDGESHVAGFDESTQTFVHFSEAVESGSLDVPEAMDAVIAQAEEVRRVVGMYKVHSAGAAFTAASSTTVMLASFLGNMRDMLRLCPLQQLLHRPRASALVAGLGALLDKALSRDLLRSAGAGAVRLQVEEMWELLGGKWQRELVAPQEADFLAHQEPLLRAVREHRILTTSSDHGGGGGAASAPSTSVSYTSTPLDMFSDERGVVSRRCQQMSGIAAVTEDEEVDLPWHDDVRHTCIRQQQSGSGKKRGAGSMSAAALTDVVIERRSVGDGDVGGGATALHPATLDETAVPLEVFMGLLKMLPRAELATSPGLTRLAAAVATYGVQRYVLLRPRLAGTAVNVVPLLRGRRQQHSAAATTSRTARESAEAWESLLRSHRLPLSSAHAADAAGHLFQPNHKAALATLFAQYEEPYGGRDNAVGREENQEQRLGSVEATTFEYMRDTVVYMHLLSGLTALMLHFQLLGGTQWGAAAVEDDNGGLRVMAGVTLSASQDEFLLRHTTPKLVNANPLESVLLHYLNIATNAVRHSDALTHAAVDRAVAMAGTGASACVAFADELRVMVAAALQDSITTILRRSDRGGQTPFPRRILHILLSTSSVASVADMGQRQPEAPTKTVSAEVLDRLRLFHATRPDLLVVSPAMLTVVTPTFFVGTIAFYMARAPSGVVTLVADCLTYSVTCVGAPLAPLLAATCELISSTPVRNVRQRMLCETLVRELVRRDDLRQALTTATAVSSREQSAAGAVPVEVLVPFLASMARWDVHITKEALAPLLSTAMHAHRDIFGHPPAEDRQGKLSLVRVTPLGEPGPDAAAATTLAAESSSSTTGGADADKQLMDTFTADMPDYGSGDTHRRALASLNLALPVAAEVAAHLVAMRTLHHHETTRARAALRAADDARRERAGRHFTAITRGAARGDPVDLSLKLDNPSDYSVSVLHLRYALYKIVQASFRRLAPQQGAAQLSQMAQILQMLEEGGGGGGGRQQRAIYAGTMRVIQSRALLCAQAVGYDHTGAPLRLVPAPAMSPSADPSPPPPLLLNASSPSLSGGEEASEGLERDAAVVVADTTASVSYRAGRKVRTALMIMTRRKRQSERRVEPGSLEKRRRERRARLVAAGRGE